MERFQYLGQMARYAAVRLAPAPTPTTTPDTVQIDAHKIMSGVASVIIPIIALGLGVLIAGWAKDGKIARAGTAGAIFIIGLVVFSLAFQWGSIGQWLSSFLVS